MNVGKHLDSGGLNVLLQPENGEAVRWWNREKDVSTSEGPSKLSELPKGFYVEVIVTYKDFVPITEKILNFWKSWTSGPGAEPGLAAEFWKPGLGSTFKFDRCLDSYFVFVKSVCV